MRSPLNPLAFRAFVTIPGMKTLDELVEIRTFQRPFFQGEMLIRPEVIDPEFFGPRFFACWSSVEKEDVRSAA
jgi:hypothetical protein